MLPLRFRHSCLLLAAALSPLGAADPLPGHSIHGEAFNEGPRQAATLLGNCGKVHLKISTDKPQAQAFFNQGLGQLHGFWYFEAERSFRQVATLDADCAMAYWGLAMANVNNEKRARQFISKAAALKSKATPREGQWIDAWDLYLRQSPSDKRDKKQRSSDLISALETLVQEDRSDAEARAFLIWKIWHAAGEVPIGSAQAVDALLDQLFDLNPQHPAHHYRIHLWDSRKPALALKSAAANGPAASAIAHMWHMPGHTYSKLKRFDDAVWQQEASTRVDHAYMIRNWVLPDQIHNYAHNEEWLIRNYNELGRAADGIALAKALIRHPRHPAFNTLEKEGSSASYGRQRLLDTLITWEQWPELLALSEGPLLGPVSEIAPSAKRALARGIAHLSLKQLESLKGDITELQNLHAKSLQIGKTANDKGKPANPEKTPGRNTATTSAAGGVPSPSNQSSATGNIAAASKAKPETKAKTTAAAKPAPKAPAPIKPDPKTEAIQKAIDTLRAGEAFLQRRTDAASLIEKATELPKPMAAAMLLELNEKTKALALIEKSAADLRGQISKAELYDQAGESQKCRKAMESVAALAFAMDKNLPVTPRLEALAKKLGLKQPWIKPAPERNDIGPRPELRSLGPIHWSPPQAPQWQALSLEGKPWSSAQLAGKAHLLLFYLGSTCTHCMEQINAFAKAQDSFTRQGIGLIAITREPLSMAGQLKEKMSGGKMPDFPVLCDPSLEAFKAFRAHDDFEQEALHAAALIDAAGRLRWIDISWEPFTNTKFLSEEAARLLSLP